MLLCAQCRTHEATALTQTGILWCARCLQTAKDAGDGPFVDGVDKTRRFLETSWQEPWLGGLAWQYSVVPDVARVHTAWARALGVPWPPPLEQATAWRAARDRHAEGVQR